MCSSTLLTLDLNRLKVENTCALVKYMEIM